MNIKKLNEEIEICLNEISDKLKGQALGKRIAKAREATNNFTMHHGIVTDDVRQDMMDKVKKVRRMYAKVVYPNKSSNEVSEAGKDYEHARELGYSDAQDFNVGDQVKLIWSGRNGIITKQIGVDVYEVEFPETPGLMARTDRYYANDLELVKSKIIDNKETDINESQKVLVSTDYGVSATLLMNEPNEEYKFVIVDQDGDGISWSDSEEEVINQYIEYMIKHEPETDAIFDIMAKEDSVKDSRIKQAFTNYLDSVDK